MKKHLLEVPLWDRWITVLVGGNEKKVIKYAKSQKLSRAVIDEIKRDTIDSGTRAAAWFCNKQGEGLMWFPKKKHIPRPLLVHEVTHIVDFLATFIGFETEMEARAHTAEWLFKKLHKLLD